LSGKEQTYKCESEVKGVIASERSEAEQ